MTCPGSGNAGFVEISVVNDDGGLKWDVVESRVYRDHETETRIATCASELEARITAHIVRKKRGLEAV